MQISTSRRLPSVSLELYVQPRSEGLTLIIRADLTHTFTSKAEHQSDVTYSIPLPPDASVHAFKALIDDRVVKGVVKEKQEARAAYQQAVSMNQKAALLQQENIESQHH
jgi:hypothetical protein